MKTIIAGSRDIIDYDLVLTAIKQSKIRITEVVCGKARGVDTLGQEFAQRNNISIKYFPADWNKLGNKAGPIRNKQMGDYADALIAVWDGHSTGTKHMIDYAKSKGLKVYVYIPHFQEAIAFSAEQIRQEVDKQILKDIYKKLDKQRKK